MEYADSTPSIIGSSDGKAENEKKDNCSDSKNINFVLKKETILDK
jgi:hypothetical protein